MSSRARAEVAKLEQKYARVHKIDRALVEAREFSDDWEVFCPSRPDLPTWTLGYND